MRSVSVKIRFITPCLGSIRHDDYDRFLRDKQDNSVIFMETWWKSVLEYGADALGKHQSLVTSGKVKVHPKVDGTPLRYRRYYKGEQYKEHEAFLSGQVVGVLVMLPDELPPEEFEQLMNLAGQFRGISPYGWREGFGRFSVVEVQKRGA